MSTAAATRTTLASLLVALLCAAAGDDEVRPHQVGPLHYEGELGTPLDADQVAVFKKLPPGARALGTCRLVVADRLEPTIASADAVLRQAAARVGGDVAGVEELKDVSAGFRQPRPDDPRGAAALEEFEMAAIVARANAGGGPLLIEQHQLVVTSADRFGDSDVTGTVTITLSRTHDEHEWRVGKVGPRYHVERQDAKLTWVTGPSGTEYDVRIVGRRAKVFRRGERQSIGRAAKAGDATRSDKQPELFYTEFTLKIGSLASPARGR